MAVAAVPVVVEAVGGEAVAAAGTGAAVEGAATAGAGESVAAEAASESNAARAAKLAGRQDLGDGHSMTISKEDIHRILHSGAAVAAVVQRATECMEHANDLAITREAEYKIVVQNRDDTTRCRATVYAANYYAVVDDAHHSTLLKAAAQTGSDPIP